MKLEKKQKIVNYSTLTTSKQLQPKKIIHINQIQIYPKKSLKF